MTPLELDEQIHTANPWQLKVQDDGVGPVLLKKLLCLMPVPSLADDHNAAHTGDQSHQPIENNGRILHDQYRDRMHCAGFVGSRPGEISAPFATNVVLVLPRVVLPCDVWLRCLIYHASSIGVRELPDSWRYHAIACRLNRNWRVGVFTDTTKGKTNAEKLKY